jgi:hypothetical protein
MLDIHPVKAEFLNKEAIRVAGLLQELDEPLSEPTGYTGKGSVAHLNTTELGPFTGPMIHKLYDISSKRKVVGIKSCEGRKCIGYDTQNYGEFAKLINATVKEKAVNELVGDEFIAKAAFSWVIKFSKLDVVVDYLEFLDNEIQLGTDLYKIYFPVINLHTSIFFRIGDVEFMYYTQDYIKSLAQLQIITLIIQVT